MKLGISKKGFPYWQVRLIGISAEIAKKIEKVAKKKKIFIGRLLAQWILEGLKKIS